MEDNMMQVGQTIKLGNEIFKIQKEYRTFYLAIDEYLTTFRRIPKLVRVK